MEKEYTDVVGLAEQIWKYCINKISNYYHHTIKISSCPH